MDSPPTNGSVKCDSQHAYAGNYAPFVAGSQVAKPLTIPQSPSMPKLASSGHAEYRPLVQRVGDRVARNEKFFSLEFFPPRTAQGLANFYHRLQSLHEGGPLFVDVTWHMGSDPGSTKETSSSSVAAGCLNYCLVSEQWVN